MNKEIKSGKEVLDKFFNDLESDDKLDADTVNAIVSLYKTEKLTKKNLENDLLTLRENETDDKTE